MIDLAAAVVVLIMTVQCEFWALLLLAGLTLALVPKGQLMTPRIAAVAVVGIGFIFELGWVIWSFRLRTTT